MSGAQSRLVSISGDQIGVSCAIFLIEDMIASETNRTQLADSTTDNNQCISPSLKTNEILKDSPRVTNSGAPLKKSAY